VIRRIYANEGTKCVPVILVTASTEDICEKAKECGAIDCIPKPIEPEELYAKIEKYILK
jgi:CheY-like chemotaxis protein